MNFLKSIQVVFLLFLSQQLQAEVKTIDSLNQFISNGKTALLFDGVSFDMESSFDLTEEGLTYGGDSASAEGYKVLTRHVFHQDKYYFKKAYEPKETIPGIAEVAWNGEVYQTYDGEPAGDGEILISKKNSSDIYPMVGIDGLLFPYKIFYPDNEQTPLLYPTPFALSNLLNGEGLLGQIKDFKFVSDKEGGFTVQHDYVSDGYYKLTFAKGNAKYPQSVEIRDPKFEVLVKIKVIKWLELSDTPDMANSIFPEEMIMIVENFEKQKLGEKKVKVKNFKWGNEFPQDQFVINGEKARYFVDYDKKIITDIKFKSATKIEFLEAAQGQNLERGDFLSLKSESGKLTSLKNNKINTVLINHSNDDVELLGIKTYCACIEADLDLVESRGIRPNENYSFQASLLEDLEVGAAKASFVVKYKLKGKVYEQLLSKIIQLEPSFEIVDNVKLIDFKNVDSYDLGVMVVDENVDNIIVSGLPENISAKVKRIDQKNFKVIFQRDVKNSYVGSNTYKVSLRPVTKNIEYGNQIIEMKDFSSGSYTSSLSRFYYDSEEGKEVSVELKNNKGSVKNINIEASILDGNYKYVTKPVIIDHVVENNIIKLSIPRGFINENFVDVKEVGVTPIKIELKIKDQVGGFEKHLLNGLVYR